MTVAEIDACPFFDRGYNWAEQRESCIVQKLRSDDTLGRCKHRIDIGFAEKQAETFSTRRMRDSMEKIIRSVLIAAMLICPLQLLGQQEPTPMDKVRVLAGHLR